MHPVRSVRQALDAVEAGHVVVGLGEFLADLRLVQSSLAGAGAVRQAYGELQHLVWQAETFGFHLTGLEVRQHSRVHARALAELREGAELVLVFRQFLIGTLMGMLFPEFNPTVE